MCGIVGYIGPKNAVDVVLQGISDLEYRGYQAAGIAYLQGDEFSVLKRLREGVGSEAVDSSALMFAWQKEHQAVSSLCVGHTRWPTHGKNTLENAHPHQSFSRRVAVVHNGTINNFDTLRRHLTDRVTLLSQTDTELVAHMVEFELDAGHTFVDAVKRTLAQLQGSYAFLFVDRKNPDVMIAAVLGSALLVGIVDGGGVIVASDESAITRLTKRVIDVEDNDVLVIRRTGIEDSKHIDRPVMVSPDEIDCQGFDHIMMKEIMEQPRVVRVAMNMGGRLHLKRGIPRLGGFKDHLHTLSKLDHVVLVACGTAYHAAMIGARYLREIGKIRNVEVMIASEADLSHVRSHHTAVIAISQSGETYDTKCVVEEAKLKGIFTIGVVNRPGSWIARATDCGVFCGAGSEFAVASTKVFVSQLSILYLIAVYLGRQRGLSVPVGRRLLKDLVALPDALEEVLEDEIFEQCKWTAENMLSTADFIAFIGRGIHYPIALEGALKLKEISYIPCEGYPAGELKHGSLALLSPSRPTVAVVPSGELTDLVVTGVTEAALTGSPIVVICEEEMENRMNDILSDSQHSIIGVPAVPHYLSPIVAALPMQLLAYFTALKLDREIDRPRQLAKSVTVG